MNCVDMDLKPLSSPLKPDPHDLGFGQDRNISKVDKAKSCDPAVSGIDHSGSVLTDAKPKYNDPIVWEALRELTYGKPKSKLIKPKPIVLRGRGRPRNKKIMIGEWCYICYHCGYFTEELILLRRHIKRKHLKTENRPSSQNLTIKREQDSEDDFYPSFKSKISKKFTNKKFKGKNCPYCDYCPKSNTSIYHANGNLKRHIKEIHTEVKKHSCEECEYKTSRKTELELHVMAKHHEKELLPFMCAICSFRTYRKANLKCHLFCKHSTGNKCTRHKRKRSEQRVMIECGLCNYKTHDNHNYKSHYLYCHSKEKPFACPYCEHRAKKSSDLKSHVSSIHTKVKKYICPHCDYVSNKSSHLASHVRRKHTRVRPHSCPHCSFAGFIPGEVKVHIAKAHNTTRKSTNSRKSASHRKSPSPIEFKIEIKEELIPD